MNLCDKYIQFIIKLQGSIEEKLIEIDTLETTI